MRPAVLTAVLLLVDILNTGTAFRGDKYDWFCKQIPSCGDGWKEVHPGRCSKFFLTPKSFSDAQQHCRSLNGELMTIKPEEGYFRTVCLTGLIRPKVQPYWIGAKKTPEGKFHFIDGSEFLTPWWRPVQLDSYKGKDACIMFEFQFWYKWFTARCSEKKAYACIKKK